MDTQAQINELKNRLDQLERSATIPRPVETAFRTRLNVPKLLTGTVTLVSGLAYVYNSSITTSSVPLVTNQTSNITTGASSLNTLGAICTNGVMTVTEGSGNSGEVINYLIIC